MDITIDNKSGFCFGVVHAIQMAEHVLEKDKKLYCLGDIVHNNEEVKRLSELGLIIINHEDLKNLSNCKVLIRAHGEPPTTYQTALKNNIELIDASCPVVLKLQNKIRVGYEKMKNQNGQVIIYGKYGHAEVNGLKGQTLDKAIIINDEKDIERVSKDKPAMLFSQTTKSVEKYKKIKQIIQKKLLPEIPFYAYDTICRQVSNRGPEIKQFAQNHEMILFVSGKKSSNGKMLYEICKSINPKTKFISQPEEIQSKWFDHIKTVGVCGATSTPMWLMKKVAKHISKY